MTIYMSKPEKNKLTLWISRITYKAIRKAILDNRDRIRQEIYETRELYELLKKWGAGDRLTPAEKQAVRTQLLDICKAIPAIAIFAIPFGSLVLVVLFKMLPYRILPTAFHPPTQKE